jgi:hypothetical protein
MAKGFGKPKDLDHAANIVDTYLAGMLAAGVQEQRGAGRVPGQSINWPRRSKNGPAHQGKQECARRVRQMERFS